MAGLSPEAPTPYPDLVAVHRVVRRYMARWPVSCCVVDAEGLRVASHNWPRPCQDALWRELLNQAVNESLRWGEPTVQYGPGDFLFWAVPLMHNARVLGGIVAAVAESDLFPTGNNTPAFDTRAACAELRLLAEQENLTNTTMLRLHREAGAHEQQHAYALHSLKQSHDMDWRQLYLLHEPALLAAVRRGDRRAARLALNHILLFIMAQTGERIDLMKSFFMELVASVCRTAVEAGGQTEQLLGENFKSLSRLAEIDSAQTLTKWLRDMLERVMDQIEHHPDSATALLINRAMRHMREHLNKRLSRDEVAALVHVSPSHFSKLFRRHTGQTFSQSLMSMRLQAACQCLIETNQSIGQIALSCGFCDQSQFTKMFRRHIGATPRAYRGRHRRRPPATMPSD